MYKRHLFVTNSSSCCNFIWGFKLEEGIKVDTCVYGNHMRLVHKDFRGFSEWGLPVLVRESKYDGSHVYISESEFTVYDDSGFGPIALTKMCLEDPRWFGLLEEFCQVVGLQMPEKTELGWFGGIEAC